MNKLIRKSECRISLAVDTTACSMKMAAAKSLANRNRRYLPTTRELSNVFTELDKTSVTQETNYVDIKASKVPHLSKIVIVLIVAGVIIVAGIIITAVVILSREGGEGETTTVPLVQQTTGTASSQITSATASTQTTSGSKTESEENLWSLWGEWTQCTSTCNSGIHKRYRRCNVKDSSKCVGDFVETDICLETVCPIYGKWTTWWSWGSCDVTCGGGKQVRTRTCTKTDSSDLDCIGENFQDKICSEWECPGNTACFHCKCLGNKTDCNRRCTAGTLNIECDTCVCDGTVITGRVLAKSTGNAVGNAAIFPSTAPTKLLTISNSTGFFTLNETCSTSALIVARAGFVDTVVVANDTDLEVRMSKLVLPYLVETPQSKYRLSGENVSLCCEAVANPTIDYYEWLKDELILEPHFFPSGNKLSLSDLSTNSSGRYQCRANNLAGAIMSPAAILTVKETPEDFCSDALQQNTITLPDDCVQTATNTATYNVGECISKKCRLKGSADFGTCREDVTTCCTVGEADLETVKCSGYELELVVVKSCTCASCTSTSLKIFGTALASEDQSPLKFGEVWANGVFQGYTSGSGNFRFDVSKKSSKITINLKDTFLQQFLQAVKVIEINDDTSGVLHVDIKMIKAAEPVEINSNMENTLAVGKSYNNDTTAVAEISIPANAFYYSNGTQYNGIVESSLTFLDPTNSSVLGNIPGVFEFIDEEGQIGNLASLAVFNLYFEDDSGQPLVLDEVIDLYVPTELGENNVNRDIKLWKMNSETGVWEYVTSGTGTRRRKRQNTATWIGEIDWGTGSDQEWFNYDKVLELTDSPCFFQIRLFRDVELSVPVSNPRRYIKVEYHTINNNLLRSVYDYFRFPEEECIIGICEGDIAYVILNYYGKNGKEALYAGEPELASSDHYYNITDNGIVLKIQMTASNDGPFYESRTQCEMSTTNDFHLRFHYGKTTEIYTFWKFFTPVLKSIQNQIRISQMTWYPNRIKEGFRVCFMKVKLSFETNLYISADDFIKVRVTSFGGTNQNIKNNNLGIREYDFTDVDSTFCVEYKCSGTIDPVFEEQNDYTRVVLSLEYHISNTECIVTEEADFISSDKTTRNQAQTGKKGTFEFYAPVIYTPDLGLYSSTSDNRDIDSATITAKSECRSGELQNIRDNNPDIGVAVTFSCKKY